MELIKSITLGLGQVTPNLNSICVFIIKQAQKF